MSGNYGYIGNNPGSSSVIVARQSFSPSGLTTTFTFFSGYSVGYLDAYLNGARLIEGQDYIASNGSTVDIVGAATTGDVLELVAYKAFNTVVALTYAPGNFAVGGDLSVNGTTTLRSTSASNLAVTGITTLGSVSAGIVSATTYYGDGSKLSNIVSGVGIQSAGTTIGTGITTLNFAGAGNTFSVSGSTATITISGGSGGGATISTTAPSNPTNGQQWFDSSVGNTYVWYASQNVWVVSQTYGY